MGRSAPWEAGILKDKYITKYDHARISFEENGFYILDNSTNGTFLNGEQLQREKKYKLTSGDKINIVDTPFMISVYTFGQKKEITE